MIAQNHRKEPNFSLRNYQLELLNKYYQSYSKGFRKPLIQAPTGSGKSILMMAIIKDFIDSKKPIILVAHKEELINQLQTHIIKNFGIEPTVIADSSRYQYDPENPFCVASIQGWASRLKRGYELPKKPEIVIIDEAHHSSSPIYSRFIEYYHPSHILGFTATPYRIDGRGFKYLDNGIEGFDILLKGPAVIDLIEQGHLSKVKFFKAEKTVKSHGLKIIGGEFSQSQLEKAIKNKISPDDVVDTWMKIGQGKKTILYPVSVELSKEYCEAFKDYGIASAHIDSTTPHRERKAILDDFRHGRIKVLCQHSIVIEGVDVPDVECVQFVRATNSLNIWWQAIGRGMRPHPNKKHLIVIDHADNISRLPLITTPINFFLDPTSLDPNFDDIPLTKCPCCSHYFQKNTTDYGKFKALNDLSEIERSNLEYIFSEQINKYSANSDLRITGFYLDLICPKCNQSFSEIRLEKIVKTSKSFESTEEEDDINFDSEIIIEEAKPRNKEEIFTIIKQIANYKCSKVKRLAYLEHELGIKNLEEEELKLFVNDCQAKKGWIYYLKNGLATDNDYFKKCLLEVEKENRYKKQKSLF